MLNSQNFNLFAGAILGTFGVCSAAGTQALGEVAQWSGIDCNLVPVTY